MKPWLEDVPDQLALALLLAKGKISCGERIGLIVVDNAVEYMLVAYVESHRRVIGPGKSISKKDWTEKKRYFEPVLQFVVSQCAALSQYSDDILNFHELRNSLYHTGQPVSVKEEKVRNYANLARNVFNTLFGQGLTEEKLEETSLQIQATLVPESKVEAYSPMAFDKAEGLVRLRTNVHISNRDAICLVLHGFARGYMRPPSFDELLASLAGSGFTLTNQALSSRLYELREGGRVSKGRLSLTSRGRKYVIDTFSIE
jgi:hypothetical protein